jgi:hypothetical protein
MSLSKLDVTVVERPAPRSGPSSSANYNATLQEIINSFSQIASGWNNTLHPLLDTLPGGLTNIVREDRTADPNPFVNGFDGSQVYLDLTSTELTEDGKYYDISLERPVTIKEALINLRSDVDTSIQDILVELARVSQTAGLTARQKQAIGGRIFDPNQLSSSTSLDGLVQTLLLYAEQLELDISETPGFLTGAGSQTLNHGILQQLIAIQTGHTYNPILNILTHDDLVLDIVDDTAYGLSWDGILDSAPSKNAIYDKIESMSGALISDVIYGISWNGDTLTAPSKNAVYDKIETLLPLAGGTISGSLTFSNANGVTNINTTSMTMLTALPYNISFTSLLTTINLGSAGEIKGLTVAPTLGSDAVNKTYADSVGLKVGGTVGQLLVKNSGTDYDASWSSNLPVPVSAPISGKYLVATSPTTTVWYGGEFDAGNSGISLNIDWNNSDSQRVLMTGNCTFTFSNPVAGQGYQLKLTQDGGGSKTATWPGSVKWSGGTAPTLTTTAGKIDLISFYYDGVDFYGSSSLNY